MFVVSSFFARLLLSMSFIGFIASFASASTEHDVYMTQEQFLAKSFLDEPPKVAKTLWLKGDIKAGLQSILDRKSVGLRQRYWQQDGSTAWVFNEIGKELPITIGVVVEADVIRQISVLVYRESRGGEVRFDFFTEQFQGAALSKKRKLDRRIDGITGATLSVRTMQRVASAALYLHAVVSSSTDS